VLGHDTSGRLQIPSGQADYAPRVLDPLQEVRAAGQERVVDVVREDARHGAHVRGLLGKLAELGVVDRGRFIAHAVLAYAAAVEGEDGLARRDPPLDLGPVAGPHLAVETQAEDGPSRRRRAV